VSAPTDDADIRLTEWTSCGGCAAKWGGSPLRGLLNRLDELQTSANLLVGLAPFDDAAVYRVSDDVALVSTTDFFPPLVDDPADFGAIAAANACSDVFAMGGKVVLALNIAAFPEGFPTSAIEAILVAAATIVAEAGGVIAGGHTIRSEEPIFGLAVQGTVHPDRILTKSGARSGDVLVLSKSIGTGIVLAGGTTEEKAGAVVAMRELNQRSSLVLQDFGPSVHAVTDVTGFGLLGHGWEIAERSDAVLIFESLAVPYLPGALRLAREGVRTGGDARNRQYLEGHVLVEADSDYEALAYDPQTSGGLLASVSPESADKLSSEGFAVVGRVVSGDPRAILTA
jgi:selenide, water dikinase